MSDTQYYQISDQANQLHLVEIDEASGDTETLSSTRNGATGQVCSDDGDGILCNLYVESSTSLRFEVVSCDSPGACDASNSGSIGVLTKKLNRATRRSFLSLKGFSKSGFFHLLHLPV